MMGLTALFARRRERNIAAELYSALVRAARDPGRFAAYEVADNLDGRFDMLVLEAALAARRLRLAGNPPALRLQKAMLGMFIADMDRNLREMGAGDLSVGKKVKAMADAFHGRVLAYDACLDAVPADEDGLALALLRNVYRGEAGKGAAAARLAVYAIRRDQAWAALPQDVLMAGQIPELTPEEGK